MSEREEELSEYEAQKIWAYDAVLDILCNLDLISIDTNQSIEL